MNIFNFVGYTVSVATISALPCSSKAATDSMETNECDCVSIKLYLHKQVAGYPRATVSWPLS